MPTKKKRVGFIPREDVMKIINKLSIENNLSNSKIINILVEEALSIKGLFNKTTGKVNSSYLNLQGPSEYFEDTKDNEKLIINPKLGKQKNPSDLPPFKQTNQNSFDIQTYKKFLSFLKFQEMMDEYNT